MNNTEISLLMTSIYLVLESAKKVRVKFSQDQSSLNDDDLSFYEMILDIKRNKNSMYSISYCDSYDHERGIIEINCVYLATYIMHLLEREFLTGDLTIEVLNNTVQIARMKVNYQ